MAISHTICLQNNCVFVAYRILPCLDLHIQRKPAFYIILAVAADFNA